MSRVECCKLPGGLANVAVARPKKLMLHILAFYYVDTVPITVCWWFKFVGCMHFVLTLVWHRSTVRHVHCYKRCTEHVTFETFVIYSSYKMASSIVTDKLIILYHILCSCLVPGDNC
jgi:hypothetical protein